MFDGIGSEESSEDITEALTNIIGFRACFNMNIEEYSLVLFVKLPLKSSPKCRKYCRMAVGELL